jgi:hypothetical protein
MTAKELGRKLEEVKDKSFSLVIYLRKDDMFYTITDIVPCKDYDESTFELVLKEV